MTWTKGHGLRPRSQGWAAEPGLTGPDAIARVSQLSRDLDPQQRTSQRTTGSGGSRLTSQADTASSSPSSSAERAVAARGRIAARPVPLRAPDRRRHRCRRRAAAHVDHVTARRLAIWLAARPQPPVFARGLVRFVNTGEITPTLKTQLRIHARSGTYPNRPQAARLMEYCIGRGADLGPVGEDFGAACDQIDRADLMLADLHDRARQGLPSPSRPGQRPTAPGSSRWPSRDPDSQTVSLILDATTANAALFAIAAHADEREAHLREVEQLRPHPPRRLLRPRNRQAIAARETRVAARLRAVEHAYRTAHRPRPPRPPPPEPTRTLRLS